MVHTAEMPDEIQSGDRIGNIRFCPKEVSINHYNTVREYDMEKQKKIALLIDADNVCASRIDQMIEEVSKYGEIILKRAYANWQKEIFKKWPPVLKSHAIKAVQQFDYIPGKNTTDIVLVIDAMCLLHSGLYDGFAIASSDSDFTPLTIHLREAGMFVIGVGEERTNDAFQKSCNVFIVLKNSPAQTQEQKRESPAEIREEKKLDLEKIHGFLKQAFTKYKRADGYAYATGAGMVIKEYDPNFNPKQYGYRNLQGLIEAFPGKYEVKRDKSAFSYRCIAEKPCKKISQKLLKRQQAILKYLEKHGQAKRKDIDQLLSLTPSSTGTILHSMVEDGLIFTEGNRKNRVYKRNHS